MLALFIEDQRVSVREVPRPERPKAFALVRVIYAGICNTDLELLRGYYGFTGIPGHEFVGEVVEADDPDLLGQRVVGDINLPCYRCRYCADGMYTHCLNRTVLGIVKHPGAFAEYLTLPERNLHGVPAGIGNEEAVFTEPLAAARSFLDQVAIPRDERIAVLGDGKLGLLIAQVLHAHGCRVHHYGRHEEKMRISRTRGIEVRTAFEIPEDRYGWVVEATGTQEGVASAIALTAPRGCLILKSTLHDLVPVDTAAVVVNELTVIGSRCGRFEPALDLLQKGTIEVKRLISEVMPLSAGPQAFERAAAKGVLKILLAP